MLRFKFALQIAIGALAVSLSMPALADEPKGSPTSTPKPPPPPPTATDEAPGGNEDNHPLVGYGAEAFIRHSAAIDCGNQAAADAQLAKLRYAIDELRKRAKAAKKAGQFSAVRPDDVQRQINLLESFLRAAEQRKPKNACPPPAQQAQIKSQLQPMNLDRFEQTMLDKTNALRASYGVPPLKWSPVLADNAKVRSVQNAQAGELVHAPREARGKERENISKVPASYSDGQIFDLWGKEDFMSGTFPNVCISGDWQTCAHKSAILWPTTEEMGCSKTLSGIWWWIVCRYYPGGNKDGQFVGRLPANYVEKVASTEPHDTKPGMMIDVSDAPNPTVINLLGDGFIYGNIDLQSDADAINVLGGETVFDGVANSYLMPKGTALVYDELEECIATGIPANSLLLSFGCIYDGLDNVDLGLVRTPLNLVPGPSYQDQGETPGSELAENVDTAVQPPVLPRTEVFKTAGGAVPNNAASQEPLVVRTAPLFDLGIYAGGAWSGSWFDSPSPDFHDGDTFFIFDPGRVVEGSALPVDTTIAPPELPNVEIYKVVPGSEPLEWM